MSVVWRRLSLAGFGRFEAPVSVTLEPGFNVLVAANERGKSTLMAGLAAVLFGLPASSDDAEFGQAKLRNWNNPLHFEGELEFVRDDTVYRVRRRFADHAVTVSEQTSSGWKDIVAGEHNPKARRRNVRYEQFLRDTVGIDNVELFWSAFCIGSPLPHVHELDEHVQRLVSGAGSAHYDGALKRLQEASFALTRFSKDIGVADQDRRKDGELERLLREEEELAAYIEASRESVDERQQMQLQLLKWQERREAARQRRMQAEAALAAWTAWQNARIERQRALQEQSKAMQAWVNYNELARRIEEETARLEADYPELAHKEPEFGDKLARLRDLESEVKAARAARHGEVAAVVSRGAEKLEAWRRFVARRDELMTMRARLKGEYAVFDDADEGTRQLYARFETQKERLAGAVERAQVQRAAAEAAIGRREAERSRFAAEYGDLDGVKDEEAEAAIRKRLAALQRRDDLLARQATLFAAPPGSAPGGADGVFGFGGPGVRYVVGLLVAAVAWGLAARALWGSGWAAAIFFAVTGTAIAWTFVKGGGQARRAAQEAQRRRDELSAQLAEAEAALAPDPRLGPFADADAHGLGVLSQRLAARRQAAAALEDDGSGSETGDAVSSSLAAAEAAYEQFLEAVRPGMDAYGEGGLPAAYAQWRELRTEAERLERELTSWVARRFEGGGLHPEQHTLRPAKAVPEDVDPDGGSMAPVKGPATGPRAVWLELARIALLMDGADVASGITVGELVTKMRRWDGTDEMVRGIVEAGGDFAVLEKAVATLRAELSTVLSVTGGDPAQALARWENLQRDRQHIQGLRERQAGLLAGHGVRDVQELHVRATDFGNQAESARAQLEHLSVEHPDLPGPEERDDGDAVAARLAALRADAAEEMAAEERAAEQYRQLLDRQAALSGVRIVNIAAAEEQLAALRARRRRLQFEIDATALAFRELARAAEAYEQTYRDVLARGASRYVQQFTRRSREVVLDERFRVKIHDPDGPVHSVARLSQGARDQLYLALRLAVADLVAARAPLPLLLDDPFVHCDAERLERIREALDSLQGGRQIVLFSHRDDFAHWGRPVALQGEGWDAPS